MNPLTLLQGFLEHQTGRGLSAGTVSKSFYLVRKFLVWLKDEDLRNANIETVKSYRTFLETTASRQTGKPAAESTVRRELSVLKSFFEYLYQYEHILVNPLEGMKLKTAGKNELRAIFTENDINIFLDSISITSHIGVRDRALFELMYSSGLRASEVLNLELEDLNLEERTLIVRQGKGKRDRYVPFSNTALKFLLFYITTHRGKRIIEISQNRRKDYLFIGNGGKPSYSKLRERFKKHLEKCGLSGKGYTMHSIRHATATHLLAHGADIRYVQELLGHEDLKTTQLYTRPEPENIKAVYRSFHPKENEYYRELDSEYINQALAMKEQLITGRIRSLKYREKRKE